MKGFKKVLLAALAVMLVLSMSFLPNGKYALCRLCRGKRTKDVRCNGKR